MNEYNVVIRLAEINMYTAPVIIPPYKYTNIMLPCFHTLKLSCYPDLHPAATMTP